MKNVIIVLSLLVFNQCIVFAQEIPCTSAFLQSDWQIIGPMEYPTRSAMGKVVSIYAVVGVFTDHIT